MGASALTGVTVHRIGGVLAALLVSFALTGCGSATDAGTAVRTSAPGTPSPRSPSPASSSPSPAQSSNAYLGESPPGSFPVPFAPGVVHGDLHTSPVFTPDGTEAYWSLQDATIQAVRLEGGEWTEPESVSFSASMTDYRDPFISPSGEQLFFLSKDTPPGSTLQQKEDVWVLMRRGDGWGKPRPLDEEVNALELHWQISVAANGDLYLGSVEPGLEDIYVSRMVDGRYVTPERLSDRINTDAYETTPYIAPDGSYLLFSRIEEGSAVARLYIAFPDGEGSWGQPVRVDSVSYGLAPVVSPDWKYVLFLSSPQTVSWVDTTFVEELRPSS
jgi:WD40-like Beta Propeller Repeat